MHIISHRKIVAAQREYPDCSNEVEYAALVKALDAVLDAGGAKALHPLASLADYLGELIADYESGDDMPPAAGGVEVLRYFMARDGLSPNDLPELGNPDQVSAMLSEQRVIDARQAGALAARFGVQAGVFR